MLRVPLLSPWDRRHETFKSHPRSKAMQIIWRCSCLAAGVSGHSTATSVPTNSGPFILAGRNQSDVTNTSMPATPAITHNRCRKSAHGLQSMEISFSLDENSQDGGKSATQHTLTLGEGSSMLSPCQPEMGTKGTVAGL